MRLHLLRNVYRYSCMKGLKRNKQTFYYSLYKGLTENVDEDGNYTGEFQETYEDAIEMKASISSGTGTSSIEVFGNYTDYDKTIITDDITCPIDENTILWLEGKTPENDKYNYIVKRVAKSLNNISYAISKVDVKANT